MTQDEIIEMANKAFDESSFTDAEVLRFAKLVAEHERDACVELCLQHSMIQLDERVMRGIDHCIEAIRARGQE